jgi:tRNA G18 (ribose-2'-O)-methylase SpoU
MRDGKRGQIRGKGGGRAGGRRTPLFVVLDDIRSVYNVGAIFRTSDAVLAEKLFLCGITPHPPRKDLEKTALGATKVVEWQYRPSARETLLKLKANGVRICALELTDRSVDFKEAKYEFPVALVLGNEVEGVGREVLELADMVVSIPMLGRAKSLNVATAYGIVAYEVLHQFGLK